MLADCRTLDPEVIGQLELLHGRGGIAERELWHPVERVVGEICCCVFGKECFQPAAFHSEAGLQRILILTIVVAGIGCSDVLIVAEFSVRRILCI